MNDITPRDHNTRTNVLAKQGVTAIGCLIGGGVLFLLGAFPPILGIAGGAVIGALGLGALFSKDPGDRKPGMMITIAGGLAILSKIGGFLRPLAGNLLGIGAVGLLAVGIWKGIQFIRGLKSRS